MLTRGVRRSAARAAEAVQGYAVRPIRTRSTTEGRRLPRVSGGGRNPSPSYWDEGEAHRGSSRVAEVVAGRRRPSGRLVRVRNLQEVDLAVVGGRARPRWPPGSVGDGDDYGMP
jgi:hypothetical protein